MHNRKNLPVFGKEIGGDIREGKKTYLLLCALKQADESQHRALLDAFADPTISEEQRYHIVRRLYDATGAAQQTQQQITEYTLRAIEALDRIAVPEEKKEPLLRLANSLTKRTV